MIPWTYKFKSTIKTQTKQWFNRFKDGRTSDEKDPFNLQHLENPKNRKFF